MTPTHADPDCPGVWRRHVKEGEFRCSHCGAMAKITDQTQEEVREEMEMHYGAIEMTRQGRWILKQEREEKGRG